MNATKTRNNNTITTHKHSLPVSVLNSVANIKNVNKRKYFNEKNVNYGKIKEAKVFFFEICFSV